MAQRVDEVVREFDIRKERRKTNTGGLTCRVGKCELVAIVMAGVRNAGFLGAGLCFFVTLGYLLHHSRGQGGQTLDAAGAFHTLSQSLSSDISVDVKSYNHRWKREQPPKSVDTNRASPEQDFADPTKVFDIQPADANSNDTKIEDFPTGWIV
ncbi:hypothetical protein scyTo_0001059 [Scyliorhinus torazame]|uniref:Uncharacterized protein n=1 Tax=Scyliorhinus torazame TaxID=75743 RepID=A0A401P8K8_SCYTO|nr:hypothetical protein [Scyliorhinus torazame]